LIRRLIGALCVVALVAAPARPLPGEVVPWQQLFVSTAGARWIDRAAQVQSESNFDVAATSYCGAVGPAQFMPATWREWSKPGESPRDPASALRAQHAYMLWLEARVGGQLDPALGAYNAGLGSVRKAQRLAQALGMVDSAAWLRTLPRVTGDAHAGETRGYLLHNAKFRDQIRTRGGGRVAF
jgi:soluble lytic murein transglycosylase-like protein